jgi:ElaB/YqjD/DUF883 family membrane-anchored ribosome-binding protein
MTPQTGASEGEAERSADEIRRDIVNRRETITDTVERLGDRIQQSLDWREYVSDYPFVSLGVAAGVGFLLSGLFKRRPTPRERILDALAESVEDVTYRVRDTLEHLPLEFLPTRKGGIGKTVKAAATAMITKKITDTLKEKIEAKLQRPSEADYEPIRQESEGPVGRPATITSNF